ncbi:MAG TPA: signal peptidase I [Anaerolineales bacterium]|nr:signal peptidase I [Anaerolineales bacterium]
MKKSWSSSAVVINLILLMGLSAIWIAFAPARLGGQVSYVIVNGISMEPDFHLGDLTILRKASAYQVGDVVTYQDAKMQAFVIHRIIGVDQDHFILKGDNNSWIDAYRPTHEEIIGKVWFHIPKLGKTFKWLRTPLNMALTIGLLGGILMAGTIKPSRRGKTKSSPVGNFGGMPEAGLPLFAFFALVFLGLSVFAFIRPLTRTADKIEYQQESHFSYSATGTPVIYDTDMVRSGEPVFPRLTCFLNIAFTYSVLGDQLQGVSGSHQLIARVMDEQSGWQRTIPMNQRTDFSGNSFSTTSTLDLCQIVSLVNTLKEETGLRANNFTLEIIPQMVMTASAEGNQIVDSFEPRLVFRFDEVHFSLSTPKGQDDPLYFSKQSSAENSNVEANTLSLLGWKPAISTIRAIALLGLTLSLGGLLFTGSRIFRTAQESQEALIRLRYGALLVNVYERNLEPAAMLIDVTTIDELAKLAERNNTVMLHMTHNFLHCYLVQCNGTTYRYVFSSGKRGVAEIAPPRNEIVEYPMEVKESNIVEAKPNEAEIYGYVINKSRTAKAEVEETVILRRIRL